MYWISGLSPWCGSIAEGYCADPRTLMTHSPSLNARTMHAESSGCFPDGWGNSGCTSTPRRPAYWRLGNGTPGGPFGRTQAMPTFDDLGFTHYWGQKPNKARHD